MARTAAGAAQAGRAGLARRPAGGTHPDPRARRGRAGGRRGRLGQRRVVRQPRRAGQATLGRLRRGPAHGARPRGPGVPGGRDPARGRRRGERRHPARAAHARPHLAHGPPQPGRTRALVPCAAHPRPAPARPRAVERPRAPHPGRRRGFAAVPSDGRPRGSSTPTAVCSPPGNSSAPPPVGGRMQAIQFHRYGGPEELHVGRGPRAARRAGPDPGRRTRAASVNPLDWKVLSGAMAGRRRARRGRATPATTRPASSTRSARASTGVAVGDEVFAQAGTGTQAEYAVLDTWARKPASVDWAVAAAADRRGRDRGTRLATVGPHSGRHRVRRRRRGRGRRGRRADGPGARAAGDRLGGRVQPGLPARAGRRAGRLRRRRGRPGAGGGGRPGGRRLRRRGQDAGRRARRTGAQARAGRDDRQLRRGRGRGAGHRGRRQHPRQCGVGRGRRPPGGQQGRHQDPRRSRSTARARRTTSASAATSAGSSSSFPEPARRVALSGVLPCRNPAGAHLAAAPAWPATP